MVASNRNRIRCAVVAVPAAGGRLAGGRLSGRGALARDLVPWADPYVMQLIHKLQDEVRSEREDSVRLRRQRLMAALELDEQLDEVANWTTEIVNDLELPWYEVEDGADLDTEDWSGSYGDESEEPTLER
jgi:hypothetical protein